MIAFIERVKNFYQQHERYLSAGALIAGFVVDNLTLKDVDLFLGNLVLFSYLVIAGGGIVLTQLELGGRMTSSRLQNITFVFPLLIQYAFGALWSGYFVFYSRSGSLTASLLFLLLILALLVGNEFFRTQYKKLVFQISIFYVALLSFVIFFIPVIMKTMGVVVFLLSSVISIALIALFTYGLFCIVQNRATIDRKLLFKSIGGIFLSINILYFANIIPPIPLSLKDIGVYHGVERKGEGYVVYKEAPLLKIFEPWNTVFHYSSGERVYVYSAVFAPTNLNTSILHRWQYFSEAEKRWVTTSNISFPITGGRNEGYRGYSFKEGLFPGKWRVDVVTSREQIVGRTKFTIVSATIPPLLEIELK